jgi:hypothetical protein
VLGDRPAVLAGQVRQQPKNQRAGVPSWLHPGKPAGDPAQQLVQSRLPAGSSYAVACGHRVIFGCPHTTGSSPVAALPAGRLSRSLTSQVTISGWSTNCGGDEPGQRDEANHQKGDFLSFLSGFTRLVWLAQG